MRHWLSPLLVLALLFGGAMANARYVSKSVDGWCAGVEASLAAAEAEDWEGAREALGAVYASWDARQTYFHIMVEHAELDAAEALFAVSHSFAERTAQSSAPTPPSCSRSCGCSTRWRKSRSRIFFKAALRNSPKHEGAIVRSRLRSCPQGAC